MRTIAIVEGVTLTMYFNDHAPPHFHALLAEHRATIEFETLAMVDRYLPRRKLPAELKCAASRQNALHGAWRSTQAHLPPRLIR